MLGTLPALIRASRALKQQILAFCALPRPGSFGGPSQPALFPDKKPEELDIKNGEIFEIAKPDKTIPVKTLAATFAGSFPNMLFASDYPPAVTDSMACMARQCYFIEIEVDTDTGGIDVKKLVVVNDAGKIINPEAYEGQQYGGTYMGLGRCKQEQIIWDPQSGVRLTDNLINYDIALMNDTESIECHQVETGLGYGPYGTYGIGESGGACACVLTRYAVHNAIGKWVDLKTTPEKILKALGKA
jgi:CO/xanthine dehydrogenase Mo-binding subunit